MNRLSIPVLAMWLAAGALFAAGTGGGTASSSGTGAAMSPSPASSALQWYNTGYAASQAGRYGEAITDFTNAISLKSDYAEAYNMLGFCTRKSGDAVKALTYYQTALKLKPDFPEAREYYGEALLQRGDLVHAVQQYIILEKARSANANELLDQIQAYVDHQ